MTAATRVKTLTVQEVSACLAISEGEIRARIRRGDLPAINVGGRGQGARYRITETALNTYMTQLAA